ncbi:DUF6452 family protein [Mangrovibacterium diazotrophicum]|uniref:Lipoprotein n=1 Tax=Mangrovibacterium diazotrophicum TaxID=1261403 RepID=A0A419W844_9BACT|nr:DUF6452 family protein [Mangrovibacterium diazotrophicum]RKD91532.1 hypothetical protein BC643_1888 [Mangrovibacterium diazotrophicum]
MKQLAQFFFLLLALAACKEVYDRPPQSQVQLNLYSIDDESSLTTLVSVYGLDQDSIWIDSSSVTYFQLPLNDDSDTSIFILSLDLVNDTIMLKYDTELVYESMESGFYTNHYLKWIRSTSNKIDSISLIDTLVISTWHENIQLYLNDSTNITESE